MVKHIKRLVIILFILVSTQAVAKGASETAREYFDSLKHGNYRAAAGYFDPAGLPQFRSLMSFDKEITDEQKQVYFQEFFEPDLNDQSFEALSHTDFLAAFLRGVLTSERFSQIINYENVEIIGEIKEQENLTHVLTRQWISLGGHKMEMVEVTSFNKVDGEWKIRITGRLKGVAVMIRQQFLQQ